MPRQSTRKQNINTFAGGLITESNPLVGPDGSISSGDNVEVLRDGSARRRRGINFESEGAFSSASFTEEQVETYAITTHEWRAADNKDGQDFQVTQVGGTLYFHKLGEENVSANEVGQIDLTPISTSSDFYLEPIHADYGKGKLFIVGRKISPAYIQYDEENDKFEGVKLTLKVRDLEGLTEEDSPVVFADEITPDGGTDADDDSSDVTGDVTDLDIFDDYDVADLITLPYVL